MLGLLISVALSSTPGGADSHAFCSQFVDQRMASIESHDVIRNQILHGERPAWIARCEKMVACERKVDADPETHELPVDERRWRIDACVGEEKA